MLHRPLTLAQEAQATAWTGKSGVVRFPTKPCTLGIGVDGGYNESQMQDLIKKVGELINASRR